MNGVDLARQRAHEEAGFDALPDIDPEADHFSVLGLRPELDLSRSDLDRAFRVVSARVHPDRFAAAPDRLRRLAFEHTAQVNAAYKLLRDRYARAEYLVARLGVDVSGEGGRVSNAPFLLKMLDLQEQVESATDPEFLEDMYDSAEQALSDGLDACRRFLRGELGAEEAGQAVAEMRYHRRLLEQVEKRREALV